jgi:class 3 adenylate cyclase
VRLAQAASAGQIVLSEAAEVKLQGLLPHGTFALHAGVYEVPAADGSTHTQTIMELVVQYLADRAFPTLYGLLRVQPGYRDAPDVSSEMAITFVSIEHDGDSAALIAGLGQACALLRELLVAHGGYECKNPSPGKFTIAFGRFEDALAFSARLHTGLLALDWPAELVKPPAHEGEPRVSVRVDGLLYRGLRARVGIAYGKPTTKKPLNSGRADYFGPLPNLAARVMGTACYGQTLIEPTLELAAVNWNSAAPSLSLPAPVLSESQVRREPEVMEFTVLGRFNLKGVPFPTLLAQAMPRSLRQRTFALPGGRLPDSLTGAVDTQSVSQRQVSRLHPVRQYVRSASHGSRIREGVAEILEADIEAAPIPLASPSAQRIAGSGYEPEQEPPVSGGASQAPQDAPQGAACSAPDIENPEQGMLREPQAELPPATGAADAIVVESALQRTGANVAYFVGSVTDTTQRPDVAWTAALPAGVGGSAVAQADWDTGDWI